MDRILLAIEQQQPRHATVVGGGFIGLEMVEALHSRGIAVTLLELGEQVMAPVDKEMANLLHATMQQHGVDLKLQTGLQAVVASEPRALQLQLSTGESLETELMILAIGVKPENLLAAQSGLELGSHGC